MKVLKQKELDSLLSMLQNEKQYVFMDTARTDLENDQSFLFLEPLKRLDFHAGDDHVAFISEMENALADGLYLAGWMSYEFGYLLEPILVNLMPPSVNKKTVLASFGVFTAPLSFDHKTGETSFPIDTALPSLPEYQLDALCLSQEKEEYIESIHTIKEYIAAGDTYQVNYTLKLLFDFTGSSLAFYRELRRNQSVAYGAVLRLGAEEILSLSPELFFKVDQNSIDVCPMKGTMKRGRTLDEDLQLSQHLRHDIKNRSENVMIVDLLRNDLARFCHQSGNAEVQTKSLFDVERYESVLQMTSTICAETNENVFPKNSILNFFKALFPCGSITGAPKIRTMEIIRELEASPRGVYTGAIGYFSPSGQGAFNVPIRTIRIADGKGEMGIGAGIIHDSDPEQEWDECLLKAHFLTRSIPEFHLIETLLWEPETGYWLLAEHLKRLEESARYFNFVHKKQEVELALKKIVINCLLNTECQKVRLSLHKDGRIEVSSQCCAPPVNRSVPKIHVPKQDALHCISLSEKVVDSSSYWFFHKTSNRKMFDDEFVKAKGAGLFDLIFLNEDDELTEGCITNIIVFVDGQYLTPPLSSGLLNGTMREYLLAGDSCNVYEARIDYSMLVRADALFCCNSVRGVVQVRFVERHHSCL